MEGLQHDSASLLTHLHFQHYCAARAARSGHAAFMQQAQQAAMLHSRWYADRHAAGLLREPSAAAAGAALPDLKAAARTDGAAHHGWAGACAGGREAGEARVRQCGVATKPAQAVPQQ